MVAVSNLDGIALLDPELFSGDDDDPRAKLIKLNALRGQRGGENVGTGTDTEPIADDDGQSPAPPSSSSTDTGSAADKLVRAATVEPMPSTSPATSAMQSARSRLQRAQQPFQPQGFGRDLVQALLTAAPAAIGGGKGAAGAVAGNQIAYQRNLNERSSAQQEYEFEAGRVERERDQQIKERLAQATLQSQAAYRTLMQSIASRRADTGQQNADTRSETAVANQASKGMVVTKGPDGVMRVTEMSADQLPIIQRTKLGLDQANEELKKAQTAAIPQQIEIARRRVALQSQMLQKALASLELQKENTQRENATFGINYGINPDGTPNDLYQQIPGAMTDATGAPLPLKAAGQLKPSGQEMSRAGAATATRTLLTQAADMVDKNAARLGPIMGRVSMAELLAGNVPPEMADLAATMGQAYAVATTAHGWRSAEAPAQFEKSIGGWNRDPKALASGMRTAAAAMDALITPGTTAKVSPVPRVGGISAASRLKKSQPANTAMPPANGGGGAAAPAPTPAPAPRVRKWTEFVNK